MMIIQLRQALMPFWQSLKLILNIKYWGGEKTNSDLASPGSRHPLPTMAIGSGIDLAIITVEGSYVKLC
jgi:hypothetical protein